MTEDKKTKKAKGKALIDAAMGGAFSAQINNNLNTDKFGEKKIILRKKPVFNSEKKKDETDSKVKKLKKNVVLKTVVRNLKQNDKKNNKPEAKLNNENNIKDKRKGDLNDKPKNKKGDLNHKHDSKQKNNRDDKHKKGINVDSNLNNKKRHINRDNSDHKYDGKQKNKSDDKQKNKSDDKQKINLDNKQDSEKNNNLNKGTDFVDKINTNDDKKVKDDISDKEKHKKTKTSDSKIVSGAHKKYDKNKKHHKSVNKDKNKTNDNGSNDNVTSDMDVLKSDLLLDDNKINSNDDLISISDDKSGDINDETFDDIFGKSTFDDEETESDLELDPKLDPKLDSDLYSKNDISDLGSIDKLSDAADLSIDSGTDLSVDNSDLENPDLEKSSSDKLFDPDDEDMDDLKDVKVDYKSSFDKLSKNSIFDDDDDIDLESADNDEDFIPSISDPNLSLKNAPIETIDTDVEHSEDSDFSVTEKVSVQADMIELDELSEDLDDVDDSDHETFWDILEQAGISIKILKKIIISFFVFICIILFFIFDGLTLFNEVFLEENVTSVRRPVVVDDHGFDAALDTAYIIGMESFEMVIPMGDFGNSFGLDSSLAIGESTKIFTQNEYVEYVTTLRNMENIYYTDIYKMLDLSINRVATLDNYIMEIRDIIYNADLNLAKINARLADYSARHDIEVNLYNHYEESYFTFVNELKGDASYAALEQFILHSKNATELKANFAAYNRLSEIYEDFLLGIRPRYDDIILNREALLKGVHVIDIENSDINAILTRY